MPKTDSERIEALERRVKALEAESETFRREIGGKLLAELERISRAMGGDPKSDPRLEELGGLVFSEKDLYAAGLNDAMGEIRMPPLAGERASRGRRGR